MERWQNRVAVVTGASSGIGEAIARDLVKAGLRVVALARRYERLQKNHSELPPELQKHFYPRKCDVANEAEVKATFEWIEATLGGVDILVNNAGTGRLGNLVEIDTAVWESVLNTNVKALIYCTQAAVKSMRCRNTDGHVVHINSLAGHRVYSGSQSFNIYSATKYAVTAMNEVFRNELRNLGTKIKTTSVSPGLVRTEIPPKELLDAMKNPLEAEDISQAVLFAISTPPHVQIHEIKVQPLEQAF